MSILIYSFLACLYYHLKTKRFFSEMDNFYWYLIFYWCYFYFSIYVFNHLHYILWENCGYLQLILLFILKKTIFSIIITCVCTQNNFFIFCFIMQKENGTSVAHPYSHYDHLQLRNNVCVIVYVYLLFLVREYIH